jgi:signal transduction histidine kinase
MEAVGQLTGCIAHDFNNLLTAISGNLDVLSLRIGDDKAKQRLIDAAQRAVERGAQLAEQLLAFARQQTLRPEIANLVMLIQDFRMLIERAAGAHDRGEVRESALPLAYSRRFRPVPIGGLEPCREFARRNAGRRRPSDRHAKRCCRRANGCSHIGDEVR